MASDGFIYSADFAKWCVEPNTLIELSAASARIISSVALRIDRRDFSPRPPLAGEKEEKKMPEKSIRVSS
jgi:hypothetical protein